MRRFLLVSMAFTVAGLLMSCGQKGPLYLPNATDQENLTAARPSTPTADLTLSKAGTDSQQ